MSYIDSYIANLNYSPAPLLPVSLEQQLLNAERSITARDGASDPPADEGPPEPDSSPIEGPSELRCRDCQGAHSIQHCPEVPARLLERPALLDMHTFNAAYVIWNDLITPEQYPELLARFQARPNY